MATLRIFVHTRTQAAVAAESRQQLRRLSCSCMRLKQQNSLHTCNRSISLSSVSHSQSPHTTRRTCACKLNSVSTFKSIMTKSCRELEITKCSDKYVTWKPKNFSQKQATKIAITVKFEDSFLEQSAQFVAVSRKMQIIWILRRTGLIHLSSLRDAFNN